MINILDRLSRLGVFKHQKIRFLFVGGVNTAFDFTLFNILIWLVGLHPVFGNTISVLTSIILSYFLNNLFVFRSKAPLSLKKFFFFLLSTGCVLLLTQNVAIVLLLRVFGEYPDMFSFASGWVETAWLESNIAKLVGISISMVANFILYKYVIFGNRKHDSIDKI